MSFASDRGNPKFNAEAFGAQIDYFSESGNGRPQEATEPVGTGRIEAERPFAGAEVYRNALRELGPVSGFRLSRIPVCSCSGCGRSSYQLSLAKMIVTDPRSPDP